MSKCCPECKSKNNDAAKFCKVCGFDLLACAVIPKPAAPGNLACGKCGGVNSIGAKFCKSCGAVVGKMSPVVASPPAPASVPVPASVSPPALALPGTPVSPSASVSKPVSASAPPLPPVADTAPVVETALKNKVEFQRKKASSARFLAGLAMVCAGLAGGGYWLMTGNSKSSAAVTPAIASATAANPTPGPAAAAANSAQVPAPVAAASSIEPIPALIPPSVQQPGAPKPIQELAPAPEPAVTLANKSPEPPSVAKNKSATEAKPPLTPDQRMADEAAMEQKASRQAIARQRERDKAKLSNANRTLDDLLK